MSTFSLPAPVAVIDVETTGLFPFRNDRIIEIAAVVIQGDGRINREFVSIVNPARDIGPTRIHGLTSEDILNAPEFYEIASQLVDVLSGVVAIAGHNVRFDHQFLEYEFQRISFPLSECFSICTMHLAGGGRLEDCCCDYGISLEGNAHSALVDARATARLLVNLLPDHPNILQELAELKPIQWPTVSRTSKQPITREESRRHQNEPPTYLKRLSERMYETTLPFATDATVMAYGEFLNHALEDRRIDESEADALVEMAVNWGLSINQVRLIHHDYLRRHAIAATEDGIITDSEQRDLKYVTRLLGYEQTDLDEILNEVAATETEASTSHSYVNVMESNLVGKRVCFTGEMQCFYEGQLISRKCAEDLATKAGLIVMNSVTKHLDLLIVADPYTQSSKAEKARQYGVRIMYEPLFWKALGLEVK